MIVTAAAIAPQVSASGASSTELTSARTSAHGAVVTMTGTSLIRAPRSDRRLVRPPCARSAARSNTIATSAATVPATGSSTLAATATAIVSRVSSRRDPIWASVPARRAGAGAAGTAPYPADPAGGAVATAGYRTGGSRSE